MDDFSWMRDAACKGQTDLMFPTQGHLTRGRKLCAECPVQPQCEDWGHEGVATGSISHGLWGGYTPAEILSIQQGVTELSNRICARPGCPNRLPYQRPGRGRPKMYCSNVCYKAHFQTRRNKSA